MHRPRPKREPQEIETAPVEIDGETYFVVRGARSFTAQERADEVKQNIIEAAEKVVGRGPVMIEKKTELGTEILADGVFVTFVTKADGQLEDLDPDLLSKVIAGEVSRAITAYREARTNTAIESGLIRIYHMDRCLHTIDRHSRIDEKFHQSQRRTQNSKDHT